MHDTNGSNWLKELWGAGDYPVILNGIQERLPKRQDFGNWKIELSDILWYVIAGLWTVRVIMLSKGLNENTLKNENATSQCLWVCTRVRVSQVQGPLWVTTYVRESHRPWKICLPRGSLVNSRRYILLHIAFPVHPYN